MAHRLHAGLVVIGLMTIGLLLAAGQAGATTVYTHNFLGSFDGAGSKGPGNVSTGPLNQVGPLAINQSTGNVFVWDTGIATLDKFDASGNPAGLCLARGRHQLAEHSVPGRSADLR